MKGIIYIAGPMTHYFNRTHAKVIHIAWENSMLGCELLRRGWCPVNPYWSVLNSGNFHPDEHEMWVGYGKMQIDMIRAAVDDGLAERGAFLGMPGYDTHSPGAVDECAYAKASGLWIYEWQWLNPVRESYSDGEMTAIHIPHTEDD